MAERVPTIIDVAQRAGVSKSAASRALLGQGRISEESRQRVLTAARELGYVKNAMAQGLSAQHTGAIGVLVRDPASVFYGLMHQRLQRHAIERGYRVVTATGNLSVEDEVRALESLVSLRVEGLVISSGLLPTERIELFAGRIPTVVAGRPEAGPLVGSVYCDEKDGARKLVAHLVELGHRSVAVLTVPRSSSLTISVRCDEMAAELRRRGVEVLELSLDATDLLNAQPPVRVLRDRPDITAVMCPADFDALGVLHELKLLGLRVPQDVSVTGYDGVPPLSAPAIGLTTLIQPIDTIAERAVRAVAEIIATGELRADHVALEGELRVGATTGAARERAGR